MTTYKDADVTNPWWPTMTYCSVSLMGFHLSLQMFLRNARRLPSIDSLVKIVTMAIDALSGASV